MLFSWINKQPGIQKFWNLSSQYQDMYDWISPFNKSSSLWFILTQGNECGKSSHLFVFTSFKPLMICFWSANFSGIHSYTLSKTLIACTCWAMQLRFFKVGTLLNNAFIRDLCFWSAHTQFCADTFDDMLIWNFLINFFKTFSFHQKLKILTMQSLWCYPWICRTLMGKKESSIIILKYLLRGSMTHLRDIMGGGGGVLKTNSLLLEITGWWQTMKSLYPVQ